jgi:fatty acid desaturase
LLRYTADRRTLGFVTTYFALLVAAWLLPLEAWATVPAMIALGSFSWFCAVITHNTVHCPIFKSKPLNRVFQGVLTLTYGHPVSTFVPGHNLSHHRFMQTPRDVMRTTKLRFRHNMLNALFIMPTVGSSVMRNEMLFIKAMRTQRPRWFRQLLIEWAVLLTVSAVLLIADWRRFVLYWYLPHLWAAFGIITINYLQHDGADAESEFNHSRNFTGKFFGWWTFNNGFHTIHHMIPGLHWSLTRDAHYDKVAPHMHPALDEPSIARYIWRALLYRGGQRLTYLGEPVALPPVEPDDENWIPTPQTMPADLSLGAEA